MGIEDFNISRNNYYSKESVSNNKNINLGKISLNNLPNSLAQNNEIETNDISNINKENKLLNSPKLSSTSLFSFINSTETNNIDPEKIEKMKKSPYSYFRATNDEFRKNILEDPKLKELMKTSTDDITIQGDAHLENVGAYKKDDGKLGFGFNDFDDSIKGSYKMDVGRLTTSIRFMAKEKGLNDSQVESLVKEFLTTYKNKISEYNKDKSKEPNYDNNKLIFKLNEKINSDNGNFIKERTVVDPITNESKFNYNPPPATPEDPNPKVKSGFKEIKDKVIKDKVEKAIDLNSLAKKLGVDPKDLKITDIANRTAGTASLGSDRYAILVENSKTNPKSQIILDMKEAKDPTNTRNAMKEYLGSNSDFGETQMDNKKFYIKELSAIGKNIEVDKDKDPAKINTKMTDLVDAIAEMMAKKHVDFGQGDKIQSETDNLEKDITDFSKIMYDKLVNSYEKFKNEN
ncbi:MAG: DUF2252 family protein [Candidatus Sericytochromatia bacterium]